MFQGLCNSPFIDYLKQIWIAICPFSATDTVTIDVFDVETETMKPAGTIPDITSSGLDNGNVLNVGVMAGGPHYNRFTVSTVTNDFMWMLDMDDIDSGWTKIDSVRSAGYTVAIMTNVAPG